MGKTIEMLKLRFTIPPQETKRRSRDVTPSPQSFGHDFDKKIKELNGQLKQAINSQYGGDKLIRILIEGGKGVTEPVDYIREIVHTCLNGQKKKKK